MDGCGWLASAALWAAIVAAPAPPANPSAEPRGSLDGIVINADSVALPFANVILVKSRRGVMTAEDGSFHIPEVPFGVHVIKVLAIGYRAVLDTITLDSSAPGTLMLGGAALERWGLSAAAAARESIGVETLGRTGRVTCEIRPARKPFRVGGGAAFRVRLVNGTNTTLWFPPSLDGSTDEARYPHVTIDITGPDGGFVIRPHVRCGNINDLDESDLVEVTPGRAFEPCSAGDPFVRETGTFHKPGRYTAVFRYSTNEPDVRKWLGWPPSERLSPELSRILRKVPLLDLACSTDFDVIE